MAIDALANDLLIGLLILAIPLWIGWIVFRLGQTRRRSAFDEQRRQLAVAQKLMESDKED